MPWVVLVAWGRAPECHESALSISVHNDKETPMVKLNTHAYTHTRVHTHTHVHTHTPYILYSTVMGRKNGEAELKQ